MEPTRVISTKASDVFCLCTSNSEQFTGVISGHHSRVNIWKEEGVHALTIDTPVAGEITSLCTHPLEVEKVFVSVESTVLVYDQRHSSVPLHKLSFSRDEIDQIAINKKGEFLAACDDSGDIQIINIDDTRLFRTCRRGHQNICSSVAFHPKRSWELISGGLDCLVMSWDFSRGRPLVRMNMQEVTTPSDVYTINPPMVHCMSLMGEEPLLICGLGNGSVAVCDISKKKHIDVLCTKPLHTTAVGSLQCLPGQQRAIVSGGNDSKLVLSKLVDGCHGDDKASASSGASPVADEQSFTPVCVHHHGSKINCLSVLTSNNTIAVADQTSDIHMYHVL